MYGALHDLVDLLKHKNLDVLAAICRLIEVVALFDENLQIMINAGVIENLAKLISTVNEIIFSQKKKLFNIFL